MEQRMKIFLVEDDKDIAGAIGNELVCWGYEAVVVKDFNKVVEELKEVEPSLVLMDISLPCFNGFYWCAEIRKFSKVPIMFLSSRGEDVDIIQGMQFGGDDYVVKPINLQILVAKIKALLRRSYEFKEEFDYLEFKGVRLFLSEVALEYQEKRVELTKTELLILEVLFKDGGGISKRDKLMDRCWQEDDFIDDNTLAVNMTRLRKKLASIGLEEFILTKKGLGYYLA